MLSDKDYLFFEKMVDEILSSVEIVFGEDVEISKTLRGFEHMGWFCIYARYKPTGMLLEFENESIECFVIRILDDDGAVTCLANIEPYNYISCTIHNGDYVLEHDNILNALKVLKMVLLRNNFPLYFSRGGKRYLKINGEIKRRHD